MTQLKEPIWKTLVIAIVLAPFYMYFFAPIVDTLPIEVYEEKWRRLIGLQAQHPTAARQEQIEVLEHKTIETVAQEGQEAIVLTQPTQLLSIVDMGDRGLVLAQLTNGERIKIYEYHRNGAFVVLTSEGIKGYLLHDQFVPSVDSFPLNILIKRPTQPAEAFATSSDEVPNLPSETALEQATVRAPKPFHPRPQPPLPSEPINSKGCTVIRCKAITQRGTRCKRNANDCEEYCWQHD